MLAGRSAAYEVMLRWTVPPEPDISSYRLYRGPTSRGYSQSVGVGLVASATLNGVVYYLYSGLQVGANEYLAVTAINSWQLESAYSNEKLYALSTVTPPRADAGPDRTGSVGGVLTLGTAPDAGVSYFWEQVAGPAATLTSRTSSSTQFSAGSAGTYEFALTAYDAQGVAARDFVTVTLSTVTPTAISPTATATPSLGGGLVFSTYLGGSAGEQIRDAVTDGQGNMYLTGGTSSSDFPTTSAAYDTSHNGWTDVFVTKLDASGQLLWSTFIGGPNYDRAYAIELDPQGNIVLTGRAGDGFPTTPGVFQPSFNGEDAGTIYGFDDCFVAKLAADGSRLLWATYVGTGDACRDVAVDGNGEIFVPGSCAVTNANQTPCPSGWFSGAFRTAPQSARDGVLFKISADGSRVVRGTYGAINPATPALRVTHGGDLVYSTTASVGDPAPVPPTALQSTIAGNGDMLIEAFSGDLTSVRWATYFGGSDVEFSETHGLALDGQDNVIIAATTKSPDLPVTAGAFQATYGGTGGSGTGGGTNYNGDSFVAKLSADGTQLLASTYLGGSFGEGVEGVSADVQGNVYVSGATYSTDFPVTAGAYQTANRGSADMFVAELSAGLTQLVYSTYVGGGGTDYGRTSTVDSGGNPILAGEVSSTNWPIRNAIKSTFTATSGTGALAKLVPGGVGSLTPGGSPQPTPTRTATSIANSTRTLTPSATRTRTPTFTVVAATSTPTPAGSPVPTATSASRLLSTGPRSPSSCTSDASAGAAVWNVPSAAVVRGGTFSYASPAVGQQSQYLKCTGFGFSLPASVTIRGILLEVRKFEGLDQKIRDNAIRIVKRGVIRATERARPGYWPTVLTYVGYGGSSDLWAESWLPSDINASSFGTAVSFLEQNGPAGSGAVDHIRITIYYTDSASGPSATPTRTRTATSTASGTATRTRTPTRTATSTPTRSTTPTWEPTGTPTATSTRTPSATQTPSVARSPSPTSVVSGAGSPLFVTGSTALLLRYLGPSEMASGNEKLVGERIERTHSLLDGDVGVLVAASGDVDGDGHAELVIGGGGASGDEIEVFRVDPDRMPEALSQVATFTATGLAASGNLALADVDASEPGDEIVVAEDGLLPARSLRIIGGLATGELRLLHPFRAIRSRSSRAGGVLTLAAGDVFPAWTGTELVIGDRRGRVYVYGVDDGRVRLRARFLAFRGRPHASARKLAVGDLIPGVEGAEIVVADDGTRHDATVRVFHGGSGQIMAEFQVFVPESVPAGIEMWIGDIVNELPGEELIVGQGAHGGRLRVFNLATGLPDHVDDLPNPLPRQTTLKRHLAIGDLDPSRPGNEVAVAQTNPHLPVHIFHLEPTRAEICATVTVAELDERVETIAVGH